MAYRQQRNRNRARQGDQTPSPHPAVFAGTLLLAVLAAVLRLPWAVVLAVGLPVAGSVARGPAKPTGRDPYGRPAPAPGLEAKQDASARRARLWCPAVRDVLDPRRPRMAAGLGLGLLTGWVCRAPWMGWLQALGLMVVFSLVGERLRGGDGPYRVKQRAVVWSKKQAPLSVGLAVLGLAAALAGWALGGPVWLFGLPLTLAPTPAWKAWRGARRAWRVDRESERMLSGWIASSPALKIAAPPTWLSGTKLGAHGERLFRLRVGGRQAWVDKSVRDAIRPAAQADGYDIAFTLEEDKNHPGDVWVDIAPMEVPDPAALAADPVGMVVRCDMEDARLGFNYSCWPAHCRLDQVGTAEDKPAAFKWTIVGPQPDWTRVRLDWLRGSTDGELGDWGTLIGVHMLVDPSFGFGWVWVGDRKAIRFDDRTASKWFHHDFSATRSTDHYLDLIERWGADESAWDAALDGGKLPVPAAFYYDNEQTLQAADGWTLTGMPVALPSKGSYQALDYMALNVRPSMGDATVADALPMRNPRDNGWFTRYFTFVRSDPAFQPAIPAALRDLTGDGPAETLMARVIVSRACAAALKRPALVGDPVQLAAPDADWTMWRVPISLTGGVTAADARKAQVRLQALAGADVAWWRWLDAGTVELWAGDRFCDDEDEWDDPDDYRTALQLRLSAAWAAAKTVGPDGRTPEPVDISPAPGGLIRVAFDIPTGLSRESVETAMDDFAANAGYSYVAPVTADRFTLLLGTHDPLPDRVSADWTLLEPGSRVLPFGVQADGTPAAWDPAVTPHLLAAGTTGSGKSSVSVTLVCAALRLGFQVAVADPSKGANDFRPIKDHLVAFCDTLPDTYALAQWMVAEMHRRVALIKANGGGDLFDLPADIRPAPLLVQIDEFNSLLGRSGGKLDNALGDPDIDNANARIDWENGLRATIGNDISQILTQARSAGIMLLLGAQKLRAEDVKSMSRAALGMLGRVFLGLADNTAGNISQANVREANRLLRQAAKSGGMPKGRGLYEPLGGQVRMVQCWWSGAGAELAAACEGLPRPERLDLSRFRPPEPRTVGVSAPVPSDTPVEAEQAADEDWDF